MLVLTHIFCIKLAKTQNINIGENMKDEIEILEYIYKVAKMEQETVAIILKKRKEEDKLYDYIIEYFNEIKKIALSAKKMIERRTKKFHDVSVLSKMATYVNVNNNITEDDKLQDIVQKLIQASNVNINEFEDRLAEFSIKNGYVINIANRFMKIQIDNIDRLKGLLKL